MANILSNISKAVLLRAAEIKGKIEDLESQLSSILSGSEITLSASIKPRRAKKRTMSPAARAKIAAAAKARWAKIKATKSEEPQKNPGAEKSNSKRKTVSAETKAKLRAAAKERWAKAKAAGKTGL